ncbi:hypothetical protein ACWD6I_26050, partial [Streptomyces sp. NPDC002454]
MTTAPGNLLGRTVTDRGARHGCTTRGNSWSSVPRSAGAAPDLLTALDMAFADAERGRPLTFALMAKWQRA